MKFSQRVVITQRLSLLLFSLRQNSLKGEDSFSFTKHLEYAYSKLRTTLV